MPVNLGPVRPLQDRVAGKLAAVVADDHPRLAALLDNPVNAADQKEARRNGAVWEKDESHRLKEGMAAGPGIGATCAILWPNNRLSEMFPCGSVQELEKRIAGDLAEVRGNRPQPY
jgi:hypothetical protein